MLMSDIRRLDDEQLKLEADSLRRKLRCGARKPPQNRGHRVSAANARDLARVEPSTVRRARPLTEAE